MVNPSTGEVFGVATSQGQAYYPQGNFLHPNNLVFVSPIKQGAAGNIITGPQSYVHANNCYLVERAVPQPCYVTPMGTTLE
jgi:hypothetical protein